VTVKLFAGGFMKSTIKRTKKAETEANDDVLFVRSVEKAFRVLSTFDEVHPTLALTQIAVLTGMDKSAAQRFTHTLCELGYLRKDETTKRFELTAKTLGVGARYMKANALIKRAMPYLLHLNRETEETVNLTILDGTEIVFVSRFLSRHVLNTDVTIGTKMPAYCTAPGRAILSALPRSDAMAILEASDLKAHTASTVHRIKALSRELETAAARGFATAFEEFYAGDASIAAVIPGSGGSVLGAVNVATSTARFSPAEVVNKFSSLVVATARSIAQS
jgi:IclR family transcriptional regulator, pca regulon regulatory protein